MKVCGIGPTPRASTRCKGRVTSETQDEASLIRSDGGEKERPLGRSRGSDEAILDSRHGGLGGLRCVCSAYPELVVRSIGRLPPQRRKRIPAQSPGQAAIGSEPVLGVKNTADLLTVTKPNPRQAGAMRTGAGIVLIRDLPH